MELKIEPIRFDDVPGDCLSIPIEQGGTNHWDWMVVDEYSSRVLAMASPNGDVLTHRLWVFSCRKKVWVDPHLDGETCEQCHDRGPKPDDEIIIKGVVRDDSGIAT